MEVEESRAYVTRNNYKLICRAYKDYFAVVDQKAKNKVYKDDLSWILSTDEFRSLYVEFLAATSSDDSEKYRKVVKRNDGRHLFVSKGAPKYHLDAHCRYLLASYENFSIPPEIEARGEEEKRAFREFAEKNKKTLYENQERFLTMLEAKFLLRNRPQKVEFDNSGVAEFSRLSVEGMVSAIDEHLKEMREFIEAHPHVERLKYARNSSFVESAKALNISDQDIELHRHKRMLKSMLSQHIAKNANSELSFGVAVLESMGFEKCSACAEEFDLGF